MNDVKLLGNLGNDPETRYTNSGKPVCTLRLATNEAFTDPQGNRQNRTEWHRVIVWNKNAENCGRYLSKGRQVLVQGRLQTRQWEDKKGVTRFTTEIVARSVQFLGGGQQAQQQTEEQPENPSQMDLPLEPPPVEETETEEQKPLNHKDLVF